MTCNNAPRRSWLLRFAGAVVLGASLVGLAQCRAVSERITGVELDTPRTLSLRGRCTHDCQADFEARLLAEAKRYRAALRACGGNAACQREQRRIHRRNREELVHERQNCKRSCYNEGAGSAGA